MADVIWRRRLRRGAVLVAALSIAALATMIALGGGLGPVAAAIADIPAWAIAAAVGCTLLEWIFDAVRFAIAGRVYDFRTSPVDWLRIALANLSAAYAGNVGPAVSAWLLARRGMAPGDALAASLAKQLLFFPVALAPAWAIVSFAPSVASPAVRVTLQAIGALCVVVLGSLLVLARSPGRVRSAIERLVRRLAGARAGQLVEQFLPAMRRFFFERPRLLCASVGFALANQAAILGTVVVLLRGSGATEHTWTGGYLFATLSQVAPTPGGVGLTEGGGALLFRGALSAPALVGFLVLARFLTIQLPILLGGWLLARDLGRPERLRIARPGA